MDAELEAARSWQQLLIATRRVHLALRDAVRAGRLDLASACDLRLLLTEADGAYDAWGEATSRSDGLNW
jgi:hypothetical protein